MGLASQQRRKFLARLCTLIAPLILPAGKLRAQQSSAPHDQGTRPATADDQKPGEDKDLFPPGSRKTALEENEKDIKKKVDKLFQLASELKDEADKTDSAKVLSVAMLKKAEEIEKLAKDIKARAKG